MKHRKQSKSRERPAKLEIPEATKEKLNQLFDRAYERMRAKTRRKEDAEHQKRTREYAQFLEAQRREMPKRDLSQVKFTHWWKEQKFRELTRGGMKVEEAKSAMWYEAARRRPEVQKAWLEEQFSLGDNGWQYFTGFVVQNLAVPWSELHPITKGSLIQASFSQWSIPPTGLSTFPTDKAEQMKVSMQVLRLPETNDPGAAQNFVEHARRFADNGFLIVAIDKKQNQAVRAACAAVEALPATFRKSDLKNVVAYRVPPNISEADERALKQLEQQDALTGPYMEELWRKYPRKYTNAFSTVWNQIAQGQERVFHKRQRDGKLIEGKQFNFERICRELEKFDKDPISDFVKSVRL